MSKLVDDPVAPLLREVCSVKQAAEYLGLSESIIRRLVREHKIPFNRIEGRIVFYLPVVREWLVKTAIPPVQRGDEAKRIQAEQIAGKLWAEAEGGN